MKNLLVKISLVLACITAFSLGAHAQFKEDAFKQNYNNQRDSTNARDSVDQMWSFKEFFHGVAHHDSTLKIGSLFAGSTLFIGAQQFYNRQYWKLPVIYGGIGAGIGLGLHYRGLYKDSQRAYEKAFASDPATSLTIDRHSKDMATYMFIGAGALYWGMLMDGTINYHREIKRQPGKATIYSILCPGLGQIYNGEAWKLPIYWGCLIGSFHYYRVNSVNYKRYKRIHNEATSGDGSYEGQIPAERALYYRDVFRRYRDYSVVAIAASYLLQVIDANVFAYMQDFEVSDNLSMQISPAVISPHNQYALNPGPAAYGFKVGFTF